ncbi:MAG: hypothetical protein TR69_WS6001001116 [candidate division WS6 bacterium OLB20]|uniref:DUF8128 domain-containing protein n=1 Tax=candidate division WS6 bacterium OLB20 TaxID=1617426 RepID=A0A136LZK9_9BACT|nr:MAG: hypothetical protein TR69_WS6001001116 [candidate division WS6 bacterium OLB20]
MPLILIVCSTILILGAAAVLAGRYFYLRSSINEELLEQVVLLISVPTKNDKTPLAAEQLFQSLHGILRESGKASSQYSFEIIATQSGIFFIAVCPRRYREFLENQIYSQYPQAQIRQIQDYAAAQKHTSMPYAASELGLGREFYLPIKTFTNFTVDPLASITGAVSKLSPGYEAWIQLIARLSVTAGRTAAKNLLTT